MMHRVGDELAVSHLRFRISVYCRSMQLTRPWVVGSMRSRAWVVIIAVLVLSSACSDSTSSATQETAAPPTGSSVGSDPTTTPPTVPDVPAVTRPLRTQPAGVEWPTESWPRGRLPDYVDAAGLESLMATTFESGGFGEIHAAVLVVGGEVVLERYGNGYLGDDPHASFSLSKSVAHALLGVLVRTQGFDMNAPVPVDQWANDERSAITPDMLLRMSSGLDWNESLEEEGLYFRVDGSGIGDLIDRRLADPPDTVFNYNTAGTALLGRLMGNLVGTGADFDAWAAEVLFDPLGITSARLGYDLDGYWLAGSEADMTALDFARFGMLYLRDGVWDGQRILPSGWVDYGRSPSATSDEYGAGWWLVDDGSGFAAIGLGGQWIIIALDLDLVFVVLARDFDGARSDSFVRRFIDLFEPDDNPEG